MKTLSAQVFRAVLLAGAVAAMASGCEGVAIDMDGGTGGGNDSGQGGGGTLGAGGGGGGGGGAVTAGDGGVSCNLCHGSALNAAPPNDLLGHADTTLRTVGAHQSHLKVATGWHRTVLCEDCHLVPRDLNDPGHLDAAPADLTFSAVANAGGVVSSWNGTTCNTWCHGASIPGAPVPAPVWTQVDQSQAYCGACHGLPPAAPHPDVPMNSCAGCHPNATNTLTFSDPARHIDGVVDLNLACNSCHGGATNNAPPRDTLGNTATTARGVGAHQAHLGTQSSWHRDIPCTDCHVVPAHIEDPGHLGTLPADLTWGATARAYGVTPQWNGATCTVYCHGASMDAGAPAWTQVGSGQAACGTCHGLPPAAPHPPATLSTCVTCHPTAAPDGGFSAPQRHVDGVLDVNVACDSCHGSAGNPAPPRDTLGNTATTARGVGAHRSHLTVNPTWHAPVTCDDCHRVPVTVTDPGHIGTPPADVIFGSSAQTAGAKPVWNGATCTNVYCHGGAFDGGAGTDTTPTWTVVNGTQDACGTCHGLPPGGGHPANAACSTCHSEVILPDGGWKNPALHIDGLVQAVAGTCGSCHDLPPPTGAHLAHASLAAPVYGGLGTAATIPGATAYAFGCGQCHPMDGTRHLNGTVDVELSNPSAPAGSLKALSPAATYVKGSTVFQDPKNPAIPYTLGTCGSVYCHSGPTFTTGTVPTPAVDFAFSGYPVTYPAFTLTSSRGYASVSWGAASAGCSGCHGFPIRTTSAADGAMAGQSHSWLDVATGAESGHGNNHGFAPLACRTCHAQTVSQANAVSRTGGLSVYGAVPITGFGSHVNGHPDVFFDVNPVQYVTSQSLATASYNVATKTCSNVACHLAQTAVKSGNPFREQVGIECDACHQY